MSRRMTLLSTNISSVLALSQQLYAILLAYQYRYLKQLGADMTLLPPAKAEATSHDGGDCGWTE
jgi:hypothetical protein